MVLHSPCFVHQWPFAHTERPMTAFIYQPLIFNVLSIVTTFLLLSKSSDIDEPTYSSFGCVCDLDEINGEEKSTSGPKLSMLCTSMAMHIQWEVNECFHILTTHLLCSFNSK